MDKLKKHIDDFIAPIKYLDSKIARNYAKLTKKWEDKKSSRYFLCHIFNIPTWVTSYYSQPYLHILTAFSRGFDTAQNFFGLMLGKHDDEYEKQNDRLVIRDKLLFYTDQLNKYARLPLFTHGTINFGIGLFNFYNYLMGENVDLSKIINDFKEGYTSFGLASSIYVKNFNHELLEKQPMWKDALDLAKKLKNKANVLLPRPVPQPSPIRTNYSLENYINNI